MVKECVSIEQDLINDQDDGVATENEQLGQWENLFILYNRTVWLCVSVYGHVTPDRDHLWCDVHEGNGEEHSTSEGVGDAEDLGVLAAGS